MKPILEFCNISKKFRIVHEKAPYMSLRDVLSSPFKRKGRFFEEFYALEDISFNVNKGESIGIIGKNGAGKSTLLKILSKITPPSSGRIVCRGRIASLLEVGTGFHPELSGRENIFLNGSILGMRQREIKNKFDEIVDFSGTERFLDTPLKHYSSGMQLRLAFSVAAFLDPEILVIDEVLAVGDAEFQKKCMGKMENVSKSGRTVLFVSHNLGAVQSLCPTSVYLKDGKLVRSGKSEEIVSDYLKSSLSGNFSQIRNNAGKSIFIERLALINESAKNNGSLELSIDIYSSQKNLKVAVDFRIHTINGTPCCFGSQGTFCDAQMIPLKAGTNRFTSHFSTGSLANGLYYLSVDLTQPDKEYYDRLEQALLFEICNPPLTGEIKTMLLDWNLGCYRIPVHIKSNETA